MSPLAKIRRKIRTYLDQVRDSALVSKHGANFFTAADIAPIVKQNRETVSSIPHWIDDVVYRQSVFNYGLPESLRPLIDAPLGDDPTYTDAMCYLLSKIDAPIRYLELGVSVGKNFFQVANFLKDASMTGFDIEEINPVLAANFTEKTVRAQWPTKGSSMKKTNSSMMDYRFQTNRVSYLSGDIFDEKAWEQLAGSNFNVIFSDAFHSSEALRIEYEMIKKYELLAREGFIIVWDDLGGEMTPAFLEIYEDLRREYKLPANSLFMGYYGGWVGQHEPKHLIGIISTY